VNFRIRTETFTFIIDLPVDFPEKAPVFKFVNPVDHPWVNNNDGVTIMNEGLAQWNPRCDITAIGKDCVHEFIANPLRLRGQSGQGALYPGLPKVKAQPKNYTVLANNKVSCQFTSKPFGLKLNPKDKLLKRGAVIFSMVTQKPELRCGMWMVTVGNRHVEDMSFSQIISLLGEASIPLRIVFQSEKPLTWLEPPSGRSCYAQKGSRIKQPVSKPDPRSPAKPTKPIPSQAKRTKPRSSQVKPLPPQEPDITAPVIQDSTFNFLDRYSINQMKDLISDDLAVEQLALSLASKDLDKTRKQLRAMLRVKATNNLAHKKKIIVQRELVQRCRREVLELQVANGTLYKEMERLAPTVDKFQVVKALQEAANTADTESQSLMDKFESDEIAVVTFLKKYKTMREAHHKFLMFETLF